MKYFANKRVIEFKLHVNVSMGTNIAGMGWEWGQILRGRLEMGTNCCPRPALYLNDWMATPVFSCRGASMSTWNFL